MGRARDKIGVDYGATMRLPIIHAGDLFNRWNVGPELVNRLIGAMPKDVYAIPGNHDLPHHRYEDVRKSAYWTLVEAGAVTNLSPDCCNVISDGLYISSFPWGHPVIPATRTMRAGYTHLAVVHAYLWMKGNEHPGAKIEDHVSSQAEKLVGYDAAVYGDNHTPFVHRTPYGTNILNHGTFTRRHRPEIAHTPKHGCLWSDGTITLFELDTSGDRFADESEIKGVEVVGLDADELLTTLRNLGDQTRSFRDAVLTRLDKLVLDTAAATERTRGLVRGWLDGDTK